MMNDIYIRYAEAPCEVSRSVENQFSHPCTDTAYPPMPADRSDST